MTQREHLHRRIRMAWKKTGKYDRSQRRLRLLAAKAFWCAVNKDKWLYPNAVPTLPLWYHKINNPALARIDMNAYAAASTASPSVPPTVTAAGPYHMSKLLGDTADPVSKDPSTDDIHLVVREG